MGLAGVESGGIVPAPMTSVYLPNFVPATDAELALAVHVAAPQINERMLPAFFRHAGVAIYREAPFTMMPNGWV